MSGFLDALGGMFGDRKDRRDARGAINDTRGNVRGLGGLLGDGARALGVATSVVDRWAVEDNRPAITRGRQDRQMERFRPNIPQGRPGGLELTEEERRLIFERRQGGGRGAAPAQQPESEQGFLDNLPQVRPGGGREAAPAQQPPQAPVMVTFENLNPNAIPNPSRDQILTAQAGLERAGLLGPNQRTGVMDAQTTAALRRFERIASREGYISQGNADGRLDLQSLTALSVVGNEGLDEAIRRDIQNGGRGQGQGQGQGQGNRPAQPGGERPQRPAAPAGAPAGGPGGVDPNAPARAYGGAQIPQGLTNDQVTRIQRALVESAPGSIGSYGNGGVDGKWGPKTAEAFGRLSPEEREAILGRARQPAPAEAPRPATRSAAPAQATVTPLAGEGDSPPDPVTIARQVGLAATPQTAQNIQEQVVRIARGAGLTPAELAALPQETRSQIAEAYNQGVTAAAATWSADGPTPSVRVMFDESLAQSQNSAVRGRGDRVLASLTVPPAGVENATPAAASQPVVTASLNENLNMNDVDGPATTPNLRRGEGLSLST